MPLPDSAPLALHVNSAAVPSRPRRAMIVRMSAETLDALENNPPVFLDFGPAPGIHVGETFFPMRPQKESSPHELYLRAASAAKPMAPLKLYANVIGKFMVERQLGDKATDKVRQQTMVAKQQHLERQAIFLNQPLLPPGTKSGKRKVPGSGTVVKKPPASDQQRPSAVASPLPASKASPDLRRRLVHFLATSPRLADDVVKMVGGGNVTASARQDLLALLEDVAEQGPAKKGDTSPRPWTLKPQTWTEVRPYEWPKLPEADRTNMARQARMAFKALRIPESDPAWDNVRYRATAPSVPSSVPAPPPMAATSSSRSSVSVQPDTKRSAIATKDKSKPRQETPRAKGEIQMKDESAKTTRVNAVKRQEIERPSTPTDGSTAAKTVATRRVPGSGYQKKTSLPSPDAPEKSGTPVDARAPPRPSAPASLPPKPSPTTSPAGASQARKTIPTMPSKPTKRDDESDRERERELERQKERDRERRERERERELREKEKEKLREERERERLEMEKREKARQKERDAVEREKRLREKEREREEMEQEKRQREKERILKERAASSALQRKAAHVMEDSPDASPNAHPPKRRKLNDGASVASSSSTARDPASGSKKQTHEPSPVPRLKMKKDPPPQPSQERRGTSSTGSAHKSERPSKSSGSTKLRRRSPIYTSSEDEGEIPQPRKRHPSPPPVSDRSNSSDQPEMDRAARHHRPSRAAYPPAHDHAALRALYQSQYSNYLGTFSKVVAQKRKIEAMLNGDSDAEVDVLDPDDLVKLSLEHKSLKTELEHIHDIYTKGTIAVAE